MPPRPSRGPAGKSQRTNSPTRTRGSGPRSARSTSSSNKGIQLRRTSVTASTSDEDADSHDEDDAIRVDDDGAPLVDGTGKQVRGGGRKRRGKVAAYQQAERAGASKWSVALVIVAVLAVAAAGFWYMSSTSAPSSTNEAAKQGAADLGADRAQPSPPVAAVPEAVPAVPEPVKPASDSIPVPPTDSKPAPAVAADKKPAPIPNKPIADDNGASSGAAGGMQVHPEPVVPQPRLALGSWDYCEAPVMLPKPGADDPNESTHTLHHAFIFVRHGDRTPTTWPVASANFSATPGPNSHSITPLWSNCDPVTVTSRTGTKRYPAPQWPGTCVLGQLTRLGAHQLNRLGRFYGKHYKSLVRTRNLRFKSTDFNRTIASAVHFAMGVYAPQRLPLPPAQLIETQHPNEDPLSLSNPKLKNTIFDFFDPTDLLAGPHGLPKLLAFGNQPWTERNLGRLFDMVATARCHDISLCLPEALPVGQGPGPCLSPVVLDRLLVWAGKQFMRVSRDFARATGGRALRELVVESRANPGLSVFATHDTTVAVLLRALDVKVDVWPAYASHVVVEKWVGKEDGHVKYRVLYNGKDVCKGKGKCGILYE